MSSFGGSCRAAFVCFAGFRFTRLTGGSGSFAAFRATVTHEDALTCGFCGSTRRGFSVVFVALGTDLLSESHLGTESYFGVCVMYCYLSQTL